MPETPLYKFPAPPAPGASEWPGTPVGPSNTITRTKGRTAVHNRTVDATPGLLEKLLSSARHHLESRRGKEPLFQDDVIIHGVRVRATTNSPHLRDFWMDNWYGVEEWQRSTGQAPPAEPRVTVYAIQGVENEQEAAYYSHSESSIVFFNTSYYGQLKSWVLGAVGRILAGEYGIHSIHGACVEKTGKGVLYIAPTGTGKSTSSYGLVKWPNTRFHSDDWVYIRYAYTTRDGRKALVTDAEGSDGSTARGYQVYRWIERHAGDHAARLSGLTLDDRKVQLMAADLDLTRPLEAYAYTSEKVFYLRTNLVESFPLAAIEIMRSKAENVPDVSAAFLDQRRATLENILSDLTSIHGAEHELLAGKSSQELAEIAARLIAFDNARSMLDIGKVLPAGRVFTNPMQPVRLAAVMLLKRDLEDPTVLNHVLLEPFMERLLIGETPDKKRETAYNAYRAVDDRAERAFIDKLEAQAGPSRPLYSLFREALDTPPSLEEEFELFRVLYNAARTYDLNTTLQRDPRVQDKRQAVELTLALIARTVEREPHPIRLTLDNYRDFLA